MKQENEKKALALQTLRLYWSFAWKYKAYTLGLIFLVPITLLTFQFLPPLMVSKILGKISSGQFEAGQLWDSFGPLLIAYGATTIIGGMILWRIVIILIWKLEMVVLRDIHQRIFSHFLDLSSTFHANRFGGSLVSQANKFAGGYIRLADTTIFQLAGLLLSFVFTAVILAPKAPMIVVILIGFSILFMTTAIFVTRKVRELNAVEAGKSNKQTGYLADAITNVLAIKAFAGSSYERKRFAKATEDTKAATNNVMKASVKRDILFAGMTNVLAIVNLSLAAGSVVLFKADIETVFLIYTYTSVIGMRLWDFSQQTLRNYNRALGDAKEMTEILNIEPGVKDPQAPEKSRIKKGAITIKNMSFTHDSEMNSNDLFKDLNLSVAPGEKVGLVGHSGSGKTSLTRLLLRFNDVDSGEILIDGQNIAAITQDDLRRNIAYVPQEPLLFHRSIAENIGYGKPGATEAEIKQAAKSAFADEFIQKLPKGYDTLVGERGVKLSGGQRQRIAIARAILKDAPILVLDEATSALDSESEKKIQDALKKLMEGRTTIVVAHRLSTIQKMDRIIVMDNGSVIEEGSHAALLEKNGTYASLWKHQSGGFLEE